MERLETRTHVNYILYPVDTSKSRRRHVILEEAWLKISPLYTYIRKMKNKPSLNDVFKTIAFLLSIAASRGRFPLLPVINAYITTRFYDTNVYKKKSHNSNDTE